MKNNVFCDTEIWNRTHKDDLWVFDKLIVAKKLGYVCGPKGINVPKSDMYIVRPCVNLMGMGLGAKFIKIVDSTDYLLDNGTFWCEIFRGRHLSVDYYKGKQVLCVEGKKSNVNNIQKWTCWEKTKDKIKYPKILKDLKGKYDWVNVEYINGKIIEIHLRRNPDFKDHNSNYVIPVYNDDTIKLKSNQIFISSPDQNRIGFIIQKSD